MSDFIMDDVYNWLYTTMSYTGFELLVFVLVDAVVKSTLRDAITDEEKQTIWMYESVGLAILCIIVYISHHIPCLLLVLTFITFVYTQLVGQASLTNIVADLKAHWENHLQHEESMKQIELQKHMQQQHNLGLTSISHVNNMNAHKTEHSSYGMNFPFLGKQSSLQYPPNATVVPGQETPAYSLNTYMKHRACLQTTFMRNWNSTVNNKYSAPDTGQLLNSATAAPLRSINHNNSRSVWSRQTLPRRSLHCESTHASKPPVLSSTIKSKVMNVIGMGMPSLTPVGLVNYGENLCFINSVVQCLARGPFLVDNLTAIAAKELECTVFESQLLSSLAELFDNLTLPPDGNHQSVSSVTKFRLACSHLCPDLVTPPGEYMKQQDAAEFLMWLLATLHDILNKNRRALHCDSSNEDKFSSPRLADLKLVYGDLTANRVHELKNQCKQDIAAANGLDNESYAEAVQRLSDLEWLIYKQAHDSTIDNLFTGQLVEAYYSVNCGNISVNLQTFNVLPVPIGEPLPGSGLVMLDDCFARFCNLENLTEPSDMLAHQHAARASYRNVNSNRHLASTPKSLTHLSQEPGDTCMPSPIHQSITPFPTFTSPISHTCFVTTPSHINANDSGFLDNTFKTSTPVVQAGSNKPIKHIQRRCLLRQLPESLVIQLMRFSYDQVAGIATKINTPVNIRLRDFNLKNVIYDTVMHRSDMTAPSVGYVYELYGLCLHLGADSTSSGHYVSYCLDKSRWYRMDDDNVVEVNMEYQLNSEEIRQNAYILFYRRSSSIGV